VLLEVKLQMNKQEVYINSVVGELEAVDRKHSKFQKEILLENNSFSKRTVSVEG
jgi:hypothetical protein